LYCYNNIEQRNKHKVYENQPFMVIQNIWMQKYHQHITMS